MIKFLKIIVLLNISFLIYSNEIQKLPQNADNSAKINFSFSANNNNLNINLFAAKDKARLKPDTGTIFLRTGIALLSAGTTSLLLGGTLIGISHLFAWYAIADFLGGRFSQYQGFKGHRA